MEDGSDKESHPLGDLHNVSLSTTNDFDSLWLSKSISLYSCSQSLASAVLAPSLTLVADSLSLEWRKQLTRRVHSKYLKGATFYALSNISGMQVFRSLFS